ncbi:hypothetical protein [Leptospira alexanderi]|uniref:hypothetical protein n=1 Tax=Leptospira alexanderi TaxID=100053 RepID=UPI000289DDA6|nr:hypothetical protein [Leptospira alexanderi]
MTKIKLVIGSLVFIYTINCSKLGIDFSSCKEQKNNVFEGVCIPGLLTASQYPVEENRATIDLCLALLLQKQTCKD